MLNAMDIQKAKTDFSQGKPVLIYHNDEKETAVVIPAEHMTLEGYKFMKSLASGDVALMFKREIAQKLGLPLLSDALRYSQSLDGHVQNVVKKSHAGPTIDLLDIETGSEDIEKVRCIKELATLVKNNQYSDFEKRFVTPGHVRTYFGRDGLLSERLGHTELGIFFSLYSGLSGMVCMVTLRDINDGHLLDLVEAQQFGKQNNISFLFEDDLLNIYSQWKDTKNVKENYSHNIYEERMYKLVLIRRFEQLLEEQFYAGNIRGSYHLAMGQEATGVALGEVLKNGDSVFVTHRGHHVALGMGIDTKNFFLECIGKDGGINGGKAGPMHFSDRECGVWLANGIVSANAPIALGSAFAFKEDNSSSVAVNIIGEGSLDEGVSSEVLNLASLWQLPLLTICENNSYSQTTKIEDHLANTDIASSINSAYGIHTEIIFEGHNLNEVIEKLQKAVEWVRMNKKPLFLEIRNYRYNGHSVSDKDQRYKLVHLDMIWREKDSLTYYENFLLSNGILRFEDIQKIKDDVESKISSLKNEI